MATGQTTRNTHTLRERRDTRSKFLLTWRCCQFLFRFFLYLYVTRGILFSFFLLLSKSVFTSAIFSSSHLFVLPIAPSASRLCSTRYLLRFFLSFLYVHDMIILICFQPWTKTFSRIEKLTFVRFYIIQLSLLLGFMNTQSKLDY